MKVHFKRSEKMVKLTLKQAKNAIKNINAINGIGHSLKSFM